MECSPPGSSVHAILQARILEWVAISFFIPDTYWKLSITLAKWPWFAWTPNKGINLVIQISSVAQSCPTLWPNALQHARLPYLSPTPELAQTNAHQVGDAIQPSYWIALGANISGSLKTREVRIMGNDVAFFFGKDRTIFHLKLKQTWESITTAFILWLVNPWCL